MYDHQFELDRINNMDLRQLLLKVKNLKHFGFQTDEQFNQIRNTVEQRLKNFDFQLMPACCGRFYTTKIEKK